MAYIGNQPALQYITFAKQTFTANGSTVAFTLDNSVANENELEVFVNNVRQEPGSGKAYTASGTTLTMSEAPNTGDDFYCIYQGKATQTVTPGNGTVLNAHLAGSIDLTSKVTGALPVANGGTNLTSGFKNGITMVDEFRLTSNFSGGANPIASNLERVDTGGQGQFGSLMGLSSGTFTFPSTGYYLVIFNTEHYLNGDDREINGRIRVTTNNSSYSAVARGAGYINGTGNNTHIGTTCMAVIDVTDTSNVKVQFRVTTDNSSTVTISDTNTNTTSMLFMRLGDT